MYPKPAIPIVEQVQRLKDKGMIFQDEPLAIQILENISHYRLKGYWWDLQERQAPYGFLPNTAFTTVLKHYHFDRHLRLIIFDAVEGIEIALRTKMINIMSQAHGSLWLEDPALFANQHFHQKSLSEIDKITQWSNEVYMKEHRRRYPAQRPESWKTLEILSFGELSRIYKNIQPQLPEKAAIANSMGLNSTRELSSWIEAFVYIRNISAHHARLWGRTLVKTPSTLNNPRGPWLTYPLTPHQSKKAFLIISALVYISNHISPGHHIKDKIIQLLTEDPTIPIHRIGFTDGWDEHDLWMPPPVSAEEE